MTTAALTDSRSARHFLDLDAFKWDDIWALLTAAREQRERFAKDGVADQTLKGQRVVGAFFEHSTRTRVSFETAAKSLGAEFIDFQARDSSMAKGESPRNTLRTLQALGATALVTRHASAGFPYFAARCLDIPVVNAGDGAHAHPTQTLADLMTILDKHDTLRDLKVAIAGDFLHSRVARSFAGALIKFGSQVVAVAPASMQPSAAVKARMTLKPYSQIQWTNNLGDAVKDAHALMVLRVHRERHQSPPALAFAAYANRFATRYADIADSKDLIVLHAGPVNEGVDLASDALRSENSQVERQVENGLFARMAVLRYVCSEDAD